MGKIYARQVNPEYQESPLFIGGAADFWPEDVIVTGNREYHNHTTDEWDTIQEWYNEAAEKWDFYRNPEESEEVWTLPEILADYGFKKRDGKPWTEEELTRWQALFDDDRYDASDDPVILEALELMTGKAYGCTEIHGCCQGDWQDMYYPKAEWSREAIEEFESEYFNTGKEWCICEDGSFDPESEDPDGMDGFFAYTSKWNEEDVKRWIGEMVGANPEDVVLYKWNGRVCHYTNEYEIC